MLQKETQPVICLKGVSKEYRIYRRALDRLKQAVFGGGAERYYTPFKALNSLNLEVQKGETVGIMGRNGSGKSTTLQIICGTLTPSAGEVQVHGRISALLELGSGFSPEFSGRENVFLNAAIYGLSREETLAKYDAIVAFSGLSAAQLEQPVHTYSSGMAVRLAFSVAIAVDPDILIIDEALAVGDEGFKRRCFARIEELQEAGTTILFVSHSAQSIIELCHRAVLLDEGEKLCEGEPKEIVAAYQRFVYATPEARQSIRADLLAGHLLARADENDSEAGINPYRREYEPDGGRITEYYLTDLEDKRVSSLQTGQRYRFHYKLTADRALEGLRFGMMVKTRRGVHVSGAILENATPLKANEQRMICFEFECLLRPDHYFLNCGFTRKEADEDVFVHRIIDAIDFNVIEIEPNPSLTPSGIVDLKMQITSKSAPD